MTIKLIGAENISGKDFDSVGDLDVAKSFVEGFLPACKADFENDGYFNPLTFIGAQINPQNNTPFDNVVVIVFSPNTLGIDLKKEGTQVYTDAVRILSKACKAVMVITVMEAWMVNVNDKKDIKSIKGSFEHVPGREEGINIIMEHNKLGMNKMFWNAKITRDENNNPSLGEWEGPVITDKSEGNFLGFIEPVS